MKKTALFLSVILFGSVQGSSQYRVLDNFEYEYYADEIRNLIKHANSNETIKITRSNKKGKVFNVITYKFNEDKELISNVVNDNSGKEKMKRLMNYEGKHLISKEIYKNNKLKYKTKNTFDGDYKTVYMKYNGKNDILYKRITEYTDKEYKIITHKNEGKPFVMRKKTKSILSLKKGGVKQANRWEYDYDGVGERLKSTLFDKNNKVKHVWDYSCKSEGELVAKKNETQFCKWEEMENGMLVKVSRKTTPKGKIEKTVEKYDADTNIVESIVFKDDVLSRKSTYDKSFSKPLTWEYYKKGRLRNKYEYVYNKNDEQIGYKSYWGSNITKPKREIKYIYKEDKLVAVNSFKNGEANKTSKITYN